MMAKTIHTKTVTIRNFRLYASFSQRQLSVIEGDIEIREKDKKLFDTVRTASVNGNPLNVNLKTSSDVVIPLQDVIILPHVWEMDVGGILGATLTYKFRARCIAKTPFRGCIE